MRELSGRVAVVTGAASGIGRALARRAAAEGMAVALADVDEAGLATLREELAAGGARARAVPTDVSRAESVDALAEQVEASLGPAALLFNNAGVLVAGSTWTRSPEDWEWVLGVNVRGVAHGVRSFVPRMLERGAPAHVVNTASVGGLLTGPYLAPYLVSKHAVVALSECLAQELAAEGAAVGVSVLCPGAVATGIAHAERNRPAALGVAAPEPSRRGAAMAVALETTLAATGAEPDAIAEATFEGVRAGRFWILPDPGYREAFEARARSILEGTQLPAPTGWS